MRQLPNALSFFRMILSILLLVFVTRPLLFVMVYVLCGISDVADGYLARRFKLETRFGAKLDSLADFMFFGLALFLFLFYIEIEMNAVVIGCGIGIIIVRLMNLILTRIKFGQWSVMHTYANKAAGFMLFLSMPICVLAGDISYAVAVPLGSVALFSSLEENLILFTSHSYDINKKSIFAIDRKSTTPHKAKLFKK